MPGTQISLQRQVTFWVVTLAAFILMVWLFSDILLPFIAGFVLAYFLDPVADALERLGLPRVVAVAIIIVAALLIIALAAMIVFPILADQLAKAAERLPQQLRSLAAAFDQSAPSWLQDMIRQTGSSLPTPGADMAARVAGWLTAVIGSIVTGSLALVNLVSLIVITPIVAFYLLLDWDRMVGSVDRWLPRDHAETIRDLARQMNAALAGFIRGQGTVSVALGLFYAVGLTLVGLNFGLLIGLSVGLLCFIPIVGTFVGAVITLMVAIVQFWPEWLKIVIVAGIFGVGQFLEGNFLSPKLVGDRVGVHPVWLMFALFAFGYLFGFTGVLLAVPLAAVVGVLCRFALKQYMASSLYLGEQGAGDPPGPGVMAREGPGTQLPLEFPLRQALQREDFFVTASNAAAVEAVEAWPNWPGPVLFLVGPPGSGKTHLGGIWRSETGAGVSKARDLAPENVPALLSAGALLVEDAPGDTLDERALFHLMNLAREQKASILLTTRVRPAHWEVSLPDLRSRLRAAALAVLEAADDDLLRGVLVKHFTDRQMPVDEGVVSLLMDRMERSLEGARRMVSEIDRRALAEKARVTRSFVARILAEMEGR